MKNGTFVSENRADYPLFIGDGPTSNVVLEGITVGGGINVYNSRNVVLRDVTANAEGSYYAIWCDEGAFVTVESGSYSSKGAGVVGITASVPSDLTVNGGEFVTAGRTRRLSSPGIATPGSTVERSIHLKSSTISTRVSRPCSMASVTALWARMKRWRRAALSRTASIT